MTRMARISLVVCVLVSVIFIERGAFAQNAQNLRRIVTFQGIDLTTPVGYGIALGVVTASGSEVVHDLSLVNALAIELPAGNITGALNSLLSSLCGPITQQVKCVEDVADDTLSMVDGGSHCVTIVPELGDQVPVPERSPWGLRMIRTPEVHVPPPAGPGLQGSGVTVAVLDTGIKASHPELSPRVVDGYNARAGANPSDWQDDSGHGTHMAGIIAADRTNPFPGAIGIVGAASQATLLAVKVLDRYGAGYLSDVINGLKWVYNDGQSPLAKVLNISIGFRDDSPPLRKAIVKLYTSGVIIVASAGNRCGPLGQEEGNGDDCDGGPQLACDPEETAVKYPAAYSEVIAVTATDVNDAMADYSCSGPQVDVAAPGGSKATGIRILSTTTGICPAGSGCYGWGSGTSQAAAHVTGGVALALQLDQGLSFTEVQQVLKTSAVNLGYPQSQQGAGRIDVYDMVQALQ